MCIRGFYKYFQAWSRVGILPVALIFHKKSGEAKTLPSETSVKWSSGGPAWVFKTRTAIKERERTRYGPR